MGVTKPGIAPPWPNISALWYVAQARARQSTQVNPRRPNLPPEVAASLPVKGRGRSEEPVSYEPNPMAKRETLELVHAYYKIEDADVRKRVYAMTKTLGAVDA